MQRLLLLALVASVSVPALAQRFSPNADGPRVLGMTAPAHLDLDAPRRPLARRSSLAVRADVTSASGSTTCRMLRQAAGGPFTEVLWESWESTWAVDFRTRAVYDGDGRETECVSEGPDGTGWVASYRETSAYDGDGRLVEEITQNDEGDGLKNWVRITYAYGDDGRLAARGRQVWEAGVWVDSDRTAYAYDGKGNRVEVLDQWWEDGVWVNSSRDRYVYEGGVLTTSTQEQWDGIDWEVWGRESYAYDGVGRLVEYVVESPDGFGGWTPDYRDLLAYDEAGNNTEYRYQEWDGEVWENARRDLYTYEAGRLIGQQSETWDGSGWVSSYRSLATRDAAGRVVHVVDEEWTGTEWENSTRLTFSYGAVTATEGGPTGPAVVRVAPNPSRGSASVAFSVSVAGPVRVTVYDRLGREVARLADGPLAAGLHEMPLDLELAPGAYVVRVEGSAAIGTALFSVVR